MSDPKRELSDAVDLDDLLALARADAFGDWADLPTFGGQSPNDAWEILSWDETRALVKNPTGVEIVTMVEVSAPPPPVYHFWTATLERVAADASRAGHRRPGFLLEGPLRVACECLERAARTGPTTVDYCRDVTKAVEILRREAEILCSASIEEIVDRLAPVQHAAAVALVALLPRGGVS